MKYMKKKNHKIAGCGDGGLRVGMVSSSLQPYKSDFRCVVSTIIPSNNCDFILPLRNDDAAFENVNFIDDDVIIRNNYM